MLAYAEGKQLLVNEDLAGLEEALGRLLQHPFAQGDGHAGCGPARRRPALDLGRRAPAGGAHRRGRPASL
ncbi:hypothetical protein G4G28_13605 [Massilia sp. Dwa41.01b]|uniref:hypothetical protein n=1 Tax=Massilia sp. Dwa41.01b TaxID=2709302 RepID=UPI00160194CC|nr:hypothetical protein [Massilia sp. Dwa41.01b]QNA89244.1 hypothetical protein G4G28_13605 [Massilia sp. Dwa41.01b]